MLSFQPITLQDKEIVQRFIAPHGMQICEYCFTDLFIWKDHYDTELCVQDDFLFIRMHTFPEKEPMYLMPIGIGDLKQACSRVLEDAKERGTECVFCSIPPEQIDKMSAALPSDYEIKLTDGSWDYIYLSDKMMSYSGKKLQSKRNFTNRFCKQWEGRWSYEEINDGNWEEAYQLHLKWCQSDQTACRAGLMYSGETCAVALALHHRKELQLRGGMIRIDGKPIAFSLGSAANEDTFVVQIEKADAEIQGAYAMIAQQFAQHNCQGYQYVNREEDLGMPGLRKSKKSYRPYCMLGKYTAGKKSDPAFTKAESINLEEI